MANNIAINGFGRIGRLTFRNLLDKEGIKIVAINDLTDIKTLAHLLKYDSAQGIFDGEITTKDDKLIVNGKEIKTYSIRNPEELPWKEHDIDLVLECTGRFVTKELASLHLKAGAKDVLLSAPAKSAGVQTIVLGVNQEILDKRHNVFSNASCTTNCFSPIAKILEDNWGIEFGSMTTVHAFTADQNIQDAPHRDLRRSRAASQNIVPTTTGAGKATGLVVPEIAGKFTAMAIRVPVISGSMIEVNVLLKKEASVEEINKVFKSYADGPMKGYLQYTLDPLVSSDIVGNPHSAIFDSQMTKVNGKFVKVVAWYDNEAGYSARLADLSEFILAK